MGKENRDNDEIEAGANLICPYCESPIEKIDVVERELTKRGFWGIRFTTMALACPRCHRLLGFHHRA